jgi:hypothetical protein
MFKIYSSGIKIVPRGRAGARVLYFIINYPQPCHALNKTKMAANRLENILPPTLSP